MEKLVNSEKPSLYRGDILRFPAKYPYEDCVDYMIAVDTSSGDSNWFLIVSSGYKAGHVVRAFPDESISKRYGGIKTSWIIKNWNKWIYDGCNADEVYIAEHYVSNLLLDNT
ncbi:MAG: hypothetical protein J6W29_09575 [Neisseriaceae bacterium]|nr:hypothetical protein [Neisseriaceae bacterium]